MPVALSLLPFSCSEALPLVPIVVVPVVMYEESSVEVMTTSSGFPVMPIKATFARLYDRPAVLEALAVLYVPGAMNRRLGLVAADPAGTPASAAAMLLYAAV